jgi:pimeloyl-ACP methyl ester carboxylesterase
MPVVLKTVITDQSEGEGWLPVSLNTDQGIVEARHYPVPGGTALAVAWVGSVSGGFDSPAHGLYHRLAQQLVEEGVASLRVRYRQPTQLREGVLDLRAGIKFLLRGGARRIALVGHSLGGAVVVQAAGLTPEACAVALLAPQTHGATAIAYLSPRCPVLLIHGDQDRVLPPACAESLMGMARYPKRLDIMHGAGHTLDEAADQVEAATRRWLLDHLQA